MAKLLLFLLLLLGCGACQTPTTLTLPAEARPADRFARGFIRQLLAGQQDSCWANVAPPARDAAAQQYLTNVMAQLRGQRVRASRVVEYAEQVSWSSQTASTRTTSLVYEYTLTRGPVLLSLLVQSQPGHRFMLVGLQEQPLAAPLTEGSPFSLAHQPPGHYLFLGLMLGVAGLLLVSLGVLVRMPLPGKTKLKWLALILLLNGVHFQFNWQTGEVDLQVLQLNFLAGLSYGSAGPGGPWLLACSLPLGALWFWWNRPQLLAEHAPPAAEGHAVYSS